MKLKFNNINYIVYLIISLFLLVLVIYNLVNFFINYGFYEGMHVFFNSPCLFYFVLFLLIVIFPLVHSDPYMLKDVVVAKGEKKQGYIVGFCYYYRPATSRGAFHFDHYRINGLRILVDNQVFNVYEFEGEVYSSFLAKSSSRPFGGFFGISHPCGVVNNKSYRYICSEIMKFNYVGDDKFRLHSFPVDVFFYSDRYYFDLDSVELDK